MFRPHHRSLLALLLVSPLVLGCGGDPEDQVEERDPDAEKERLRKFLEQVKSLAPLYDSAKPHEKRNIVRWATSNRTVAGKSIAFEPSNWLEAAQFVLAAPYGEGQRPTPRTPTEMLIRRLDELNEFLKEEKEPDLLRDLMDMFDRYISAPDQPQHES